MQLYVISALNFPTNTTKAKTKLQALYTRFFNEIYIHNWCKKIVTITHALQTNMSIKLIIY